MSRPLRLLVNAANVTAAGPVALVRSLVPALAAEADGANITVVCADPAVAVAAGEAPGVETVVWPLRRGVQNDLARLLQLHLELPRLARRVGAEALLTLGDVGPVIVPCPHLVFLHLSLLVYGAEEVPGGMWSWPRRSYLRRHFAASVRRAAAVVVQTPVMASRLAAAYQVDPARVHEIAQPVPRHVGAGTPAAPLDAMVSCGKPIRLLVLAAYQPHKNHRVLVDVARELRRRGLAAMVQIFTTVAEDDPRAQPLLRALTREPDVITNLGRLPGEQVRSAFAAASALLLPTLVESYGLIYLEAMACGVPVLTSERDFARWMCRDLALYFDPLDPVSIVDAIERLGQFDRGAAWTRAVAARLTELPADWGEVARRFLVLAGAVRSSRDHLRRPA